jgi:hypothetical protein
MSALPLHPQNWEMTTVGDVSEIPQPLQKRQVDESHLHSIGQLPPNSRQRRVMNVETSMLLQRPAILVVPFLFAFVSSFLPPAFVFPVWLAFLISPPFHHLCWSIHHFQHRPTTTIPRNSARALQPIQVLGAKRILLLYERIRN